MTASLEHEVDGLIEGIRPTIEGIAKIAESIQARGRLAEAEGKPGFEIAHAEAALLIRSLMAIAGNMEQMARLIENQSQELRIQRLLPEILKPKLMLQ